MTEDTVTRAVVSWAGAGQPVELAIYGPGGEVAVALAPERALALAQELLECGVQAIKEDSWDTMYKQRGGLGRGGSATPAAGHFTRRTVF